MSYFMFFLQTLFSFLDTVVRVQVISVATVVPSEVSLVKNRAELPYSRVILMLQGLFALQIWYPFRQSYS